VERTVDRPTGGGCKEALEITHAIAAITTRVDPVVAKAPGIAPRPDRVRMNAEQSSGLGDGQGRVGWARR
jgi:hypothetical protein